MYDKWTIETTAGLKLSGADNHIVFNENYDEIFLCELSIGDKIITDNGIDIIKSVVNNHVKENMYDISVNSVNHRFYSNGILSHNSTSYSIYVLWYVLMNENKSVLICANKFKTAKEILSRVKMAYEMLPKWLKPRNYNVERIVNRI